MTKTLLCGINSKYIHSSLAVWYLKAYADSDKQNIKIIEWTINNDREKLVTNIVGEKPDVVAFSCYIWNIRYVYSIIPKIKQALPNAKIILGGPEVSYNSEDVIKYNDVDFVISGEGEVPFKCLLDSINDNTAQNGIEGVFGKDFSSTAYVSCEIPPSPYTEEYFDMLGDRMVYFETTRGCPFSCSFCLSGRCGGVKYFPLERVKSEIVSLANTKTKTIKFVDRSFNANNKRALEIVNFITESSGKLFKKEVEFHFEVAGDIMSAELIDAFMNAPKGLFRLEIGLQSFNERTLEFINRKTDTDKLKRNIALLLKNNNVHVHIDLIAGLPHEDLVSFKNGFNTAFNLKPQVLQLGFLKLLHGSPMEDNPMGEFDSNPPYSVLHTPWLSEDDLAELSLVEEALEKLYNSARFKNLLTRASQYFESAYQMFKLFSESIEWVLGESLDEFTFKVFKFFSLYIEEEELREIMCSERLRINSSCKLPIFLRDKDYTMGKLLRIIDDNTEYKRISGTKRAATYLKSSKEMFWVDYSDENYEDNKYNYNKVSIDIESIQLNKQTEDKRD